MPVTALGSLASGDWGSPAPPAFPRDKVLMSGLACLCVSGCSAKFWEPATLGRFRPTPAVNVILGSLGVAEEPPMAWEGGTEPRMEDSIPLGSDYTLGVGDAVTISVFELLAVSEAESQIHFTSHVRFFSFLVNLDFP